jgi:phage terminase large subunit-like protein
MNDRLAQLAAEVARLRQVVAPPAPPRPPAQASAARREERPAEVAPAAPCGPALRSQPGGFVDALRGAPENVIAEAIDELSDREAEALLYDWRGLWARPEQLAPPDDAAPAGAWLTWLILSGRGWGKTRTGAQWVIENARAHPKWRWALVARTAADVRDTMIEGESGLIACSPPDFAPNYEPSKRRLTWPNGFMATTFTAEEPDALRGPQHHGAWADELASWKYLEETWDNLMFGLRLGDVPRVLVTTTPRPVKVLRELMAERTTVITRGSTFDNAANLAPPQLAKLRAKYEGTRLGRQELNGEVLDDVPGALWTRAVLDELRVRAAPELVRIVVGVDPAVTAGEESDDTGIVAAGKGADGHFYVLADRTCHLSPDAWARRAVVTYDDLQGDLIVGEVNNGGDLVETTIRTVRKNVPFKAVRASRGKRVRAEPISALYEQKKVHHVGALAELEDQMVTFLPEGNERSPDRVDALVWALTELSEGSVVTFGDAESPTVKRSW